MQPTSSLARQMKHRDREMVPRVLVLAIFGMMLSSLALVSYARLTGREPSSIPAFSAVVTERIITLDGSRENGVTVRDANGNTIAHSTENKSGFIDVIWLSIARERIVQDMPADAPVRLVRRENGHVAVIDDTTGWKIELIGYGQDNVAAFARLID